MDILRPIPSWPTPRSPTEDIRQVALRRFSFTDQTKERITKKVYGKARCVVVTYNQNLFDTQWLTLHNDIRRALGKLAILRQKLEDRANGLIKGGKTPTKQSIENQCKGALSRQYLKRLINTTVIKGVDGLPRLSYDLDSKALSELADTYLGKNIIITDRQDWDDEADHICLSQSVHHRGRVQTDEGSTNRKLVAPSPLDGFQDANSWSLLHNCSVAQGLGVSASQTGRHGAAHVQVSLGTR